MITNGRHRTNGTDDVEVLADIAEEYYVDGQNQEWIAQRHGISRSYVSRLLQRARDLGVVEVIIHRETPRNRELETAFQRRFGLDRCFVVDCPGDPDLALKNAGQMTVNLLAEKLSSGSTLALGWGQSVRAVVDSMTPGRLSSARVVQMFGGFRTASIGTMSGELVAEAARIMGATEDRLHAPWIVETPELARSLLEQPDVAAVLRRAAEADVAVSGIGAAGRGSSALLFGTRYLSADQIHEIEREGAVGDICGRLFDAEGRACRVPVMSCVIGLDLETIRRIPMMVGIAVGREKAVAILGALRGGLLDALVTDTDAARAVLAAASDSTSPVGSTPGVPAPAREW
jgi:DNA-binding transcriptional regulator LsrR (DeoR family)